MVVLGDLVLADGAGELDPDPELGAASGHLVAQRPIAHHQEADPHRGHPLLQHAKGVDDQG